MITAATFSFSQRWLFGTSLVLAPLFFAISSFYWTPTGDYGVTGGTWLVFGSIFWITAFIGLFDILKLKTPCYATWGLLFAVYGAVCGGAAFAFQGLFVELLGVSHSTALKGLEAHPAMANAIFWIGGPAFPLSLLVLGIMLAKTKTAPWWVGAMLSLGGMLFPVARIPRIEWIAHAVDLLMLVPALYLGIAILRRKDPPGKPRGI